MKTYAVEVSVPHDKSFVMPAFGQTSEVALAEIKSRCPWKHATFILLGVFDSLESYYEWEDSLTTDRS